MSQKISIECRYIGEPVIYDHHAWRYNDRLAVHCIHIPDLIDHLDILQRHLSPEEQLKSGKYRHEKDTRRYIIAKSMLRILLGKYLGKATDEIQYVIGKNLKPELDHGLGAVHFNVSHSGSYIMVVIGNRHVGIDVEYIDPEFDYGAVLQRTFNEEESSHIMETSRETFYRLWTRKEAFLKATGKGIDDDMKHIPSIEGRHHLSLETLKATDSWTVDTFKPGNRYVCSVAYAEGEELKIYKVDKELLDR